ncbi:MAG: hypothetical protein KJO66_08045, partial [Gammaproteobacteria bacterium]|nr:hypothetical protein [Gammaproteobacteria bacterium]
MIFRILLSLLFVSPAADALTLDSTPVPGGIAIVALPENVDPASARYREKKVLVTDIDGLPSAVIGLSLGTRPGRHFLSAVNTGGKSLQIAFDVESKAYEEQRITIKDKRKVTPEKRDMERITREQKVIKKALRHWTDTDEIDLTFELPVDG